MTELAWDQIVTIVRNRQSNNHVILDRMIEVKDRYNGDWVMPAPDEAALPTTTPQLIADAIDFVAMQGASVMPFINCPTLDLSKETGVRSREYGAIRRKALGATHHKSRTKLQMRRAMRHLAGYATASFIVVPNMVTEMPQFELRDPLTSYPEPKAPEDLSPPKNAAFVYGKSSDWLLANYPECRKVVPDTHLAGTEELWDMVEWVDEHCTVIGLLGPREGANRPLGSAGEAAAMSMEMRRWPNKTGICPVYIPNRVTLDRIVSQIANLTGSVDLMNRMNNLGLAAAEKAIFKDRYIIGDSTRPPVLVTGEWQDGRTGKVNIIQDAKAIGELASTPDQSTQQMIDRIERSFRVSSGLVPQAGGESYGALRTGRGMDSLMGASIDPRVQEIQEIVEVGLEHVNTVMLETYKAYWPEKKYTLFSGWQGDKGMVEFTPEVHIETTDNVVAYTIPGSDIQGTTIQLGQLVGMKAISLHTLRSRHPYIDDPDAEADRVDEETLEDAALQGLAQQVVQGAIPVTYLAKVEKHRRKGKDIIEAILKADEEMKEEQAKLAPPPGEDQFASPGQMPGLAGPGPMPPAMPPEGMEGMGAMPPAPEGEMPPNSMPGQIGPQEDQRGLRRLMEALSQRPPATG
jgi:hypothetical protein